MHQTIIGQALKHSDKAAMPVARLNDLRNDIQKFSKEENLNHFQTFIIDQIYRFEPEDIGFIPQSVIVIATPTPPYANVIFNYRGNKILTRSLARHFPGQLSPEQATKLYLNSILEPAGHHIEPAPRLPLKRLAVAGGLAEYGRNNICYVSGMGSFFVLNAYFTDVVCEDNWHEVKMMDRCHHCTACINHCPTGAIVKDRFLIDNERCLSCLNEMPGEFPEWLAKSAHHLTYDCLMCQETCPQNKNYINNRFGPVEFDASETELLLSGQAMDGFPLKLLAKVKLLGMDQWMEAIPRNLEMLFENARS